MKTFIVTLLLTLSLAANAQGFDPFAPVPESAYEQIEPETLIHVEEREPYVAPAFEVNSRLKELLLGYYTKQADKWLKVREDEDGNTYNVFTEINTQLETLRECAAFRTTQAFYAREQNDAERYSKFRAAAENLFAHFSIYAFALQERFTKEKYDVNAMRQQHFDQSSEEMRDFITLFTSSQGVADSSEVTTERRRIIETCNAMEESTNFLNEKAAEHLGPLPEYDE